MKDNNAQNHRYAILMNGYTASLKTYTARRIANMLKIPLIETNRLGRCTGDDGCLDDALREKRYELAFRQAQLLIKAGLPVVVDGTFNFHRWRDKLYRMLTANGIKDIIVVRCVCDNKHIIRARVMARQANRILPENEAASMENYFKTREDDESVYEDSLPSVVEFRTGPEYTVEVRQGESETAEAVRNIVFESFHTGRLNEH